ncbi:MAG TPA: flagellar basal body L-ring protein FlgH [Allosphingosinicella sp.]|nr:flagellar basal body L-ring protein FlgH [Allosphingosinicella sp.]
MIRLLVAAALVAAVTPVAAAAADDLYPHTGFAALAADRTAQAVGDILLVQVIENANASNTSQKGSRKNTSVQGDVGAGKWTGGAHLGLGGGYDGTGQTTRSEKMVAQISVAVDAVLPNGDLHIAGAQALNINGEKTFIRLRGRIRREDLHDNAILSSRIADAEISYDGSGFVSRSTKPGLVTRIFSFLGLL